jgi:hypothetical protein
MIIKDNYKSRINLEQMRATVMFTVFVFLADMLEQYEIKV